MSNLRKQMADDMRMFRQHGRDTWPELNVQQRNRCTYNATRALYPDWPCRVMHVPGQGMACRDCRRPWDKVTAGCPAREES